MFYLPAAAADVKCYPKVTICHTMRSGKPKHREISQRIQKDLNKKGQKDTVDHKTIVYKKKEDDGT